MSITQSDVMLWLMIEESNLLKIIVFYFLFKLDENNKVNHDSVHVKVEGKTYIMFLSPGSQVLLI